MNLDSMELEELKKSVEKMAQHHTKTGELMDRVQDQLARTEGKLAGVSGGAPHPAQVKATPFADGSCRCSINGTTLPRLSRSLWRLLHHLLQVPAGDGWVPVADACRALGITAGAYNQRLHRLYAALGTFAGLVEHDYRGQIRFHGRLVEPRLE